MLVDGKHKVRFMYREQPDKPTKDGWKDSGWRFFCGDEDQAYTDVSGNIAIYDINTILNLDKSIKPYLNSTVGSAFERKDDSKAFTVVEDFAFGSDLK